MRRRRCCSMRSTARSTRCHCRHGWRGVSSKARKEHKAVINRATLDRWNFPPAEATAAASCPPIF
jgi:hypothetical protein